MTQLFKFRIKDPARVKEVMLSGETLKTVFIKPYLFCLAPTGMKPNAISQVFSKSVWIIDKRGRPHQVDCTEVELVEEDETSATVQCLMEL